MIRASKIMGLLGQLQYILLSVSLSMYSVILLSSNSAMLMLIIGSIIFTFPFIENAELLWFSWSTNRVNTISKEKM